jgi:hypothetical protein
MSEELRRERQREARARKRLRQRIERARWRAGRDDWIVSDEELDALFAGEKTTPNYGMRISDCGLKDNSSNQE